METATGPSAERLEEGISIQQFVENMQKNQELYRDNYEKFTLKEEDEQFFRSLGRKLYVMVLAEDWCGDVLRYLPAFQRISEVVPNWEVRVFRRDDNLDLADLCLKEGKYRAIPVFKFLDEKMQDMGCFIERPPAVYEIEKNMGQLFATRYPEVPDALAPLEEMSENTRDLYTTFVRQMRAESRPAWQQLFVEEIKNRVREQ